MLSRTLWPICAAGFSALDCFVEGPLRNRQPNFPKLFLFTSTKISCPSQFWILHAYVTEILKRTLWIIHTYLCDSPVLGRGKFWTPLVGKSPPKYLPIVGVQFRLSLDFEHLLFRITFLWSTLKVFLRSQSSYIRAYNFWWRSSPKLSKQRDSTHFFAIRFPQAHLINVLSFRSHIPSSLPSPK
jgi:hypothetical protein